MAREESRLPKLIGVFTEAVTVSGRRSGALPRGVPEVRVARVGRGEGTWDQGRLCCRWCSALPGPGLLKPGSAGRERGPARWAAPPERHRC